MKAHIHVGVRPCGCLFLFSWPCILRSLYCSHSNPMSARYPASDGHPPPHPYSPLTHRAGTLTTIWISYFFFILSLYILCIYTHICFAIPNGPAGKLNNVFFFKAKHLYLCVPFISFPLLYKHLGSFSTREINFSWRPCDVSVTAASTMLYVLITACHMDNNTFIFFFSSSVAETCISKL